MTFFRILWTHLAAVTSNDDHHVLFRVAAVRPITGDPIVGWRG